MQRFKRGMVVVFLMSVPFILNRALYVIGCHEVAALWDFEPLAVFLYSRPADQRYVTALTHVTKRARALGFRFKDPKLLQTNELYDVWYHRWEYSGYGIVEPRGGHSMLVDSVWLADFSDTDLECVIAHELGHVIDDQTHRIGIPMGSDVWCLGSQEFADSVGRLICGTAPYNDMMRRYQIYRPMTTRDCSATTPVR